MEFIIITGMSGAGKSVAANALEDIGFYCIDNMPPNLIPSVVELSRRGENNLSKIAIVTDTRGGELFKEINPVLKQLKEKDFSFKLLFLDANDGCLIRRYKETRRLHPMGSEISLEEAVKKERKILDKLKQNADFIIDTTHTTAASLKNRVSALFVNDLSSSMSIQCISFGFKYGSVHEADLVFDVRCLPNPYYVEGLRELTGLDEKIKNYVLNMENSVEFAKRIKSLLDFSVPLYCKEGKSQLVIAIGCTGGKHRSVVFAELIYKHLLNLGYKVSVYHRDITKG